MNTYYDTATQLFQQGEYKKAIKILEQLTKDFPDILMFKSLLGISYLKNKNTGKAITTFENLITIQPNNASFIACLADAYLIRGWHNKAIGILKNSISIYENNFSSWFPLAETSTKSFSTIEAKKILNQLLQRDADKDDVLTLSVYFHLFFINLQDKDFENMKTTLEYLSRISLKLEESREHTACVLLNISEQLVQAKIFEPVKDILNTAEIIDPNNEKIKALKANIYIPITPQADLLQFKENSINLTRKRYYDFHNNNNNKPYVRKELKIGRNAPCPCGSEKKHKKCCGKQNTPN